MPSFPIWGYELDPWQWYPIDTNPKAFQSALGQLPTLRQELLERASAQLAQSSDGRVDLGRYSPRTSRSFLAQHVLPCGDAERWIKTWPAYAGKRDTWPKWKVRFLAQNRNFALRLWSTLDPGWLRDWLDELFDQFPSPSHQKLEWNCKGAELDIKAHIVQFRPSGIRVQRLRHIPALVAMTTTQIPIIPARIGGDAPSNTAGMRHLLPSEGLQLQGFPPHWKRPNARESAFRALGNAVNAELISEIVATWLGVLSDPPSPVYTEIEGEQE
jgi:hypothetical protein